MRQSTSGSAPRRSAPRRRAPRGRMLPRRLPLRVLVPALLVALVGLVGTAPAGASPAGGGFRFWGYYELAGGQWQFAETGADATSPADGTVEGWRFAASGLEDTRFPRATPTFEEVCGDTDASGDSKRVAVVVDYGRAADSADGSQPPAARAECAVVPSAASGADALAAVAEVRSEEAMTCGVDGWPASGCGDPVQTLSAEAVAPDEPVDLAGLDGDDAAPAQGGGGEAEESSDGPGAGLWVGLGAVVLVAVIGGLALLRRRGASD